MSGSGASTSAAARRGLPEIDYAAPVWVGKSDCWHGSVTTRSVMAVRLMQFGVDQLVVTGSVVMRQSSCSRCSDESGATRRRQRETPPSPPRATSPVQAMREASPTEVSLATDTTWDGR
jgi:hypothetical protein